MILNSPVTRLATAAAVIAAALLLRNRIVERKPPQVAPQLVISPQEQQSKQIVAMLAARDIDGLVRMLSEGQFESKVLAALCLGEIGDERALPKLRRLYIVTQAKPAEGYVRNPFAEPIERINKRLQRIANRDTTEVTSAMMFLFLMSPMPASAGMWWMSRTSRLRASSLLFARSLGAYRYETA
jgi:hypothetical protein